MVQNQGEIGREISPSEYRNIGEFAIQFKYNYEW